MTADIPDYQAFFEPILKTLQYVDEFVHLDEISEEVSAALNLSTYQLNVSLPSGRQTVFENHLQWALSYLKQAHLIDCDGAQAYRITQSAIAQLETSKQIKIQVEPASEIEIPVPETTTFSTTINQDNFKNCIDIRREFDRRFEELKNEILEKVYSKDPAFFENLIIDLLLAMGYGNRRRDLANHLGRTGDGGIDGAINQDQLGLDVVYIQAKRYKRGSSVPVSSVRDFAGAIEAHKANKGVFVTTSTFTKSAKAFIHKISKRIVLIDGDRLSELLIRNNIGVKVKETFEVKRIDEDYFT